jgi:intein/homing endonuclease
LIYLLVIKRKYKDAELDEFKLDKIINNKARKWDLSDFAFEEELYEYLSSIKKLASLCKLTLTTQKNKIPELADKYGIQIYSNKDLNRILSILEESVNDKKTYDFDDMVFLPAIDPKIWLFPQDYVLVDECFPYNQYIKTEFGKKKIGQLEKMYSRGEKLPMIETFNQQTNSFEKKNIVKIWCNGEKDIYEVIVGGKRKIKSTKNHKYLTIDGWKRLDELKIGDAVLSNNKNQPYHTILNESQENIFIGSILGDGSLHNLSKNISRIRVIHGEKQKNYIEWKASFFNSNVELVENNGSANKIAYRFTSKGFYFDDKYKNIKNVIDTITLKSLAIAWMDDGSISSHYLSSRLYSCAESKELSEYLSDRIEKKWKIKSQVKSGVSSSTKKEYYWLCFNKENTERLSNLISQFIHPSMKYKLCPKHRNNIDLNTWKFKHISYGCMVITKEYEFIKRDKVYDMEVMDNHNFIITSKTYTKNVKAKDYGFIAHNCQDMNRAQQEIVKKILKKDRKTGKIIGRLISVGDNFQSIYGFSGADIKSFDWFRKFPNTITLPLTTTFRCSKNVVLHANKIVPDLKAMETAKTGSVRNGDVLKEAKSGDFVLCRKTLPLVKLFFQFLSQHKKAIIKGSDIGVSLFDMVKRKRNIDVLKSNLKTELKDYGNKLKASGIINLDEHSGYSALQDRIMTLLFIAEMSKDMYELKRKISEIFTDKIEGIVLSTVHKIKGLEADRVFIIRPDILPMQAIKSWERQQEKNLEYVAITRAKNILIYDYSWNDELISLKDIKNDLLL